MWPKKYDCTLDLVIIDFVDSLSTPLESKRSCVAIKLFSLPPCVPTCSCMKKISNQCG